MEKQVITEEMHPEKEWFEQAEKIETTKELVQFVNHILNDYKHDYGTVCHAVSACALAGAWLGCHTEGLTGFQASFVMWDFIRNWTFSGYKCGLSIVNYDDMLYPQYEYKFDKTITKSVWKTLQEEAKKNLNDRTHVAPKVRNHWRNIACGIVPFGYRVEDD